MATWQPTARNDWMWPVAIKNVGHDSIHDEDAICLECGTELLKLLKKHAPADYRAFELEMKGIQAELSATMVPLPLPAFITRHLRLS